jgi:hypothetical protein
MLQEQETPIWLADPRHLAERRDRVSEGAYGQGIDDGMKVVVRKGQMFRVHDLERHVSSEARCTLAGQLQHRWTDVDGRQLAGRGVVR